MRVLCHLCLLVLCVTISGTTSLSASARLEISAEKTNLVFRIQSGVSPITIVELAPFQSLNEATNAIPVFTAKKSKAKISVPRLDGPRDRIYSAFVALHNGQPI